ncbi:hypothetical protein DENIS_0489 [Desulfonema ishimotonii]|uniref:Uncharacterized protein n=1 Tax=Desulfonema ishimotonii TaxID=45657 RepID=A0A401FRG9_9BACT|nr:hypothetical protein DENIS_0489 [Desulfonema ishimotonii]
MKSDGQTGKKEPVTAKFTCRTALISEAMQMPGVGKPHACPPADDIADNKARIPYLSEVQSHPDKNYTIF